MKRGQFKLKPLTNRSQVLPRDLGNSV